MSSDSSRSVCLVLGAGGFRGLAHVGVLRGLQRLQIGVESLIGVSMGGLVAAFAPGEDRAALSKSGGRRDGLLQRRKSAGSAALGRASSAGAIGGFVLGFAPLSAD